jgi:hypothetical protein
MKKVWCVKSGYRGFKWYTTEKAFLTAVRNNDKREVFVFELVESGIAEQMKDNTIKTRNRDNQLNAILGEKGKYDDALIKFKILFNEIAPESRTKQEILRNLEIIGLNKKHFSQIASNNIRYLLFEVSDTFEWYQTLLRCHNFKSLPLYWCNHFTEKRGSDQYIENFKNAKLSLKNKI